MHQKANLEKNTFSYGIVSKSFLVSKQTVYTVLFEFPLLFAVPIFLLMVACHSPDSGNHKANVKQNFLSPDRYSEISENSELEYRFHNKQLFLKIKISEEETEKSPQDFWALLDSSATHNLMVDLDFTKSLYYSWGKEGTISQEFQPLGSETDSHYKVILGQPFFRANCMEWNRGVPIRIKTHNKKKCMDLDRKGREDRKWDWIPLEYKSGQYLMEVAVDEKWIQVALDSGSGMTALPGSLVSQKLLDTGRSKKIIYTFGSVKKKKVYRLRESLLLRKGIAFYPEYVLDSEEVWEENYEYFPTIGMDFFRIFRVYIDFGSKIVGIERDEKQRQNHSGNERRSR